MSAKPAENKQTAVTTPTSQAPAGYKQHTADCVGYWRANKPPCSDAIHFIPREVTMVDSSIDANKPSALIIGELVDACTLMDSDKAPVQAKPGDRIGVWYASGMAAIADCANAKVWMKQEGEKVIKGKPKPMKCYTIMVDPKAKPGKLMVTNDRREDSASIKTAFSPLTVSAEPPPF